MQWLPDTIDAITRMFHEAGVVGSIAALLSITVALLLWRHLGQIIEICKASLLFRMSTDKVIVTHLKDISSSNSAILDRVSKLPSDKPECKAKSSEELKELIKSALVENGHTLSPDELSILMKHRTAQ